MKIEPVPRTLAEFVAPRTAALVLWDFQRGLAGRAYNVAQLKEAATRLIDCADRAGVLVVWSRHVLPSLDLIPGPFLSFLMKKQNVAHPDMLRPTMQEGMEETQFLDGLTPAPNHLVLQKSMPSFFVGTPFDLRLKARGITTVILTGVATEIGVEFTARHAMASGYYSVIVEDATSSYTKAAHERSVEFMREWFPVASTAEICREWSASR